MISIPVLYSLLTYGRRACSLLNYEAFLVEKDSRYDLKFHNNRSLEQNRICFGTNEFNKIVKTLPGSSIQMELQTFFERTGIRRDIIILEKHDQNFCYTVGMNFFLKSPPAIIVPPDLNSLDRDACHFIVKHECGHLNANDMLTIHLVPAISSFATALFSSDAMTVGPALAMTVAAGSAINNLFLLYREGKADDWAIAQSSIEELKGGWRFLVSIQENQKDLRIIPLEKIYISPTGENRKDLSHPSLASRIKKIENALNQRNIKINRAEEEHKINNLKQLMLQKLIKE